MFISKKDKMIRKTSVNTALEVLISVVQYDHITSSISALINSRKNHRLKSSETQNDLQTVLDPHEKKIWKSLRFNASFSPMIRFSLDFKLTSWNAFRCIFLFVKRWFVDKNAFSETRTNAFFIGQDADWYLKNVLIRLRLTSKKRNCT